MANRIDSNPYASDVMSAAAYIAIRRKKLIRRFREAGATDADHAVSLESLGEHRSWIFAQMIRHGVFVPTVNGRFFMDERAADAFRRRQRRRAWCFVGIALLALLVLGLLGRIGK